MPLSQNLQMAFKALIDGIFMFCGIRECSKFLQVPESEMYAAG